MDSTSLLIVPVVILVVALVILYLFRQGLLGGARPGVSKFVFTPTDQIGSPSLVKRKVMIDAPDQLVAGNPRKLAVEALPLPDDPKEPPDKEKRIDRLITSVIHPRVTYADTSVELYDFDPPLTVTINYDKSDADQSGETDGRPNLSIVTFYPVGERWLWQKLETGIDIVSKTCTAKLQTLTPKDPVGMGMP